MHIKINSLELMNKFKKAVDDIKDIKTKLEKYKKATDTKLNILNIYNNYTESLMNNISISESNKIKDRYVFNYDKSQIVDGNYDSYGQVVHSSFVKMPSNLFNFITEAGPIFKDNAKVEFYTDEDDVDCKYEYNNILKYENDISKENVFKVFKNDTVTMAIQVNLGNLVSNSKFNMIEICPYLQGSFDITGIRIFTEEQYYSKDTLVADKEINTPYKNVGNIRIALDKKMSLYRIEFDIKINYQEDGYPFGLRHLYFYDAEMDTENDYIILKVDKNEYIEYIGENISIITPQGDIKTTASKYGVEYYMFYTNGVLQIPISNPIARNINKFYAKIPLTQPLIGIEFEDIATR